MKLKLPSAQYYKKEWALDGNAISFIFVHDISVLVSPSHLKVVKFDDIDYCGLENYPERAGLNCNCCDGWKYIDSNISFPCILIDGLYCPNGLRYRMIDGRHRIDKMKFNKMTEAKFYVFDYSEVKELFYHCNTNEERDKIVNNEAEKCMYFDDILDWM